MLARLLTLLAALAVPGASLAAETIIDPNQKVGDYANVSYMDLLRMAIPDLAMGQDYAAGRLAIDLPSIDGPEGDQPVPEKIQLGTFQAQAFEVGGGPYVALLVPFGDDWQAMLAVYSMDPTPRLVDAADVGMDRFTGFASESVLHLGEDDDAIVTTSSHFNAGESYETQVVIQLHNGQLRPIDVFSSYAQSTCELVGSAGYGFASTFDPTRDYYAITATLTEIGEADPECHDKKGEGYVRTRSTVYRWDGATEAYVKAQ